ncbi:hypothetical protein [Streptomyces sp. UNOB3_S3]|uniref:hypothetical protein n=1 Tax=Streptomyces sp. UNOB3_S3 TaxID=2871682 RepID=UPI001E622D6E|nr:hypothetical protein [Streptomyces sp. UNOB3_S3]MCC3773789.1 hypothetical protein [Streptomyces sp. UNOB3_S3]
MARIRTIKPEAFCSESLAAVSITAERTFFGLLTQADDHGRFRDQPAVIAGLLWSLRPEHGPLEVEEDLSQLADAGLICRYEGAEGKRYLHIVTWRRHQKINRPSGVRHPACPHHDDNASNVSSAASRGAVTATPVSDQGGLTEGSRQIREAPHDRKIAGHSGFSESSWSAHGGLTEASVNPHGPDLGPRNRDLGDNPLGGASAPAPHTAPVTASAKSLVAEYVAGCHHRPPEDVLGLLGRKVKTLLEERFDAQDIRTALDRLRARGLHPSVLPSLVNEVVNAQPQQDGSPASSASGAGPWASNRSSYTPYLNPTEPTTFGGRL